MRQSANLNGSGKGICSVAVRIILCVLGVALLLAGSRPGSKAQSYIDSAVSADEDLVSTLGSGTTYANCRFGVGRVYQPLSYYDISGLNLGWYLDWRSAVDPERPSGMEYVQMIRVRETWNAEEGRYDVSYSPSGQSLVDRVQANPGSYWSIGNEPDCVNQDNMHPESYARVYHEAHNFIKAYDPTAKVVAGNIVQPTPVRMVYLDLVLQAYRDLYGETMPADAWGVHSFILREATCAAFPDSCWGSDVPPGVDVTHGELYEVDQADDLQIFQDRILEFREWMASWGYREIPLLITEYSSWMPDHGTYEGWDQARTKVFLYGTFDYLLTATDSEYGYPPDENRLVQRWLWYSLDDEEYGGFLYNQYTADPRTIAQDFGAYTSAISPTVDLYAVSVRQVEPVPYSPTQPVTITLRGRVANVGNIPVTQSVVVRFYDEGGVQIGADQVITGPIGGCADFREATVAWPNVSPGAHSVRMAVDQDGTIDEKTVANNEVTGTALVATDRVFLPLVSRSS